MYETESVIFFFISPMSSLKVMHLEVIVFFFKV